MTNSHSSILTSFNALDTLVLNTANADVTMSVNLVYLVSFFWYFLVSAVATPITLSQARDIAPSGILTGRPIKILNVATVDIPEGTRRPLEQAFSHISRSKALEYSHVSFHTFHLVLPTPVAFL